MNTRLIGLDWGSTHLRAYRFGDEGIVEEQRALSCGIRQLPAGGFVEAFDLAVDGWPDAPIVACGMVGSRNGWQEVRYLDTPLEVGRLAGSLTAMPLPDGRILHLVPGLRDPDRPDVMRGEETQIVGALEQCSPQPWCGSLLLPGTHSKWVRVRDGIVTGFATAMTGELYGLLRRHSILGAQLPADAADDDEAFRLGVYTARDSGAAGGFSRLFSARTLLLDGVLAPASVADYLSGLLIGDELRMALAADWIDTATPVQTIGDGALCLRYREAAGLFGLRFTAAPETTTARGLWRIASEGGLLADRPQRASIP